MLFLFKFFRLANDSKGKGGERQFNGLVDVYVKTLKSDGIQGLYRGFTISAVGIFIYRGMYFGLYDTLKPLLLGKDAGVLLSFFLGWAVTVTAGLMSYPIGEAYFSVLYSDPNCPVVTHRMSVLEVVELQNLFLTCLSFRHREEEDDDDLRRWR